MNWENSADWYDKIVGAKGHYYHEHLIIPRVLGLLEVKKAKNSSIVDFGCGQGVLAKQLPANLTYLGIDAAPTLLKLAEKAKKPGQSFLHADLTQPIAAEPEKYTHGVFILSLQNMPLPQMALRNAQTLLKKQGKLILVLNHPCFRIPRQSSWQVDAQKKIQYRRVDRYFTPLEIPIQTHPGGGEKGPETRSYHFPLSTYTHLLKEAGFVVLDMEEWCSDKESEGKARVMENRSRREFPLFLTLICSKT